MSESSDAVHAGGTPAPSPQLQRLDALVGRWRSQGHIVSDSAPLYACAARLTDHH